MFQQYIDEYGFLVDTTQTPHGVGDSCWRSSWYYFALCTGRMRAMDVKNLDRFLKSFLEHCCVDGKLYTHPSKRANPFTRDQLSPLILLLITIKKYQPHFSSQAKAIALYILKLDSDGKNMAKDRNDPNTYVESSAFNDHIRYVMTKLSEFFGIYYGKPRPAVCFSPTLSFYETLWENQGVLKKTVELADGVIDWFKKLVGKKHKTITVRHALPRPYTIWNNVALITAVAVIWDVRKDRDLKCWRKSFSYYADHNWGVAYKVVAGKPYNEAEFYFYKSYRSRHLGIESNRGYAQYSDPQPGEHLCLDYPILLALQKIWG